MIRDFRFQISVLAATKSQIKYTVLLLLLLVVVHSKAATLHCTHCTALAAVTVEASEASGGVTAWCQLKPIEL